jgi:hypothetical protein
LTAAMPFTLAILARNTTRLARWNSRRVNPKLGVIVKGS